MNGGSRNLAIMVGATLVLVLALFGLELSRVLPKMDVEAAPPQKTITVTGQGQVSAEPDLAMVVLGAETRKEAVGDAIHENNTIMEAVRATLADLGIADEDIQTVVFSVNRLPRSQQEGDEGPVRYSASNMVQVKIREFDRLGEVLEAVTTSGANTINSVVFTIEDPSVLQDQAREKAIADAMDKAEQTAQAAGVGLGDLLNLNEFVGFNPSFQTFARYFPAPADALLGIGEVPIAGGVLEVVVQVNATFAIAG